MVHKYICLVQKSQSNLHLLRSLRSFGVCRPLLRTFYDTVVASAIFCTMLGSGSSEKDRKKINKLVMCAGSILGCFLDSTVKVGEGRMLAKLTSIMYNPSHPLYDTVGALSSSFNNRLKHSQYKTEHYCRSLICHKTA